MRQPITVLDDHDRAVRARFFAALERGMSPEEASEIANSGLVEREPVELAPPPAEIVQEVVADPEPAAPEPEPATVEGANEANDASLANLDRDGDGDPGGSLPADQQGDEIEALRAEAEAKGIAVDKRWGAPRLRKEIAKEIAALT
ncbi:MAG: hypothetical protein ACK4FB_08105 [Brevundimonas sp.]|uniref:hypothetical protein n=1 Tax=Brevundimonas sp. TaxID=1871086 RepID=UPI00391CF10A